MRRAKKVPSPTPQGSRMPEAGDGSMPGQLPEAQAGQAPPPRPPAWRRRSVLITSIAAAAAVAAAAAAVVMWPGSQPQRYATLPPPCTLVTAATLARYLPGATSAPLRPSVPGSCSWLSSSGPLGQCELVVTAAVFGSSSGVAIAKKIFDLNAHTTMQTPHHEITFTVTRRSVPGLGDQAVAQIFQPGKNALPQVPVIEVGVRSRNADITVTLSISQAGSAPLPTGPQLVSDTIAIARDVLAVLVNPGTT
jgi:hypothetical protein